MHLPTSSSNTPTPKSALTSQELEDRPKDTHIQPSFETVLQEFDDLGTKVLQEPNKSGKADKQDLLEEPKKKGTVAVFWDLDNIQPRGPPREAVDILRGLASRLGMLTSITAYGNRRAFIELPRLGLGKNKKNPSHMEALDDDGDGGQMYYALDDDDGGELYHEAEPAKKTKKGKPVTPFRCSVCGSFHKDERKLAKHIKIHTNERTKMMRHLATKKTGTKKKEALWKRYEPSLERYARGFDRVSEDPSSLGLRKDLEATGVRVLDVGPETPNAADVALRRDVTSWLAQSRGGTDWMILVSDDQGFEKILESARKKKVNTFVVHKHRGNVLAKKASKSQTWQHLYGVPI